ncbi:hypothetical protein [Spirosoma luteum]|nr:hypothetical protein [Spirosoma luteum]
MANDSGRTRNYQQDVELAPNVLLAFNDSGYMTGNPVQVTGGSPTS